MTRYSVHYNEAADRRHSDRFPLQCEMEYRVLSTFGEDQFGNGKTLNMSSRGILFTSDQVLPVGRRLELSISWPALRNRKLAIRLLARGRVVRVEYSLTAMAMEIQQHEFLTETSAVPSRLIPF